jgi:hypothetical protein
MKVRTIRNEDGGFTGDDYSYGNDNSGTGGNSTGDTSDTGSSSNPFGSVTNEGSTGETASYAGDPGDYHNPFGKVTNEGSTGKTASYAGDPNDYTNWGSNILKDITKNLGSELVKNFLPGAHAHANSSGSFSGSSGGSAPAQKAYPLINNAAPAKGSPTLYIILGVLVLILIAAITFIAVKK